MKSHNNCFSPILAAMLLLFSGSAQSMSVLKGTYDCLEDGYGYLSPYFGAGYFEDGFLRNIYHFGPHEIKIDENNKAIFEAQDSTTALVRAFFHENSNDGQFTPSILKDIEPITPELIGEIVGHIVKGDLQKVKKKIIKKWADISQVDGGIVGKKMDLVIESCKECDTKKENAGYPPHTTEFILIGFLYAKYITDSQAQEQGKAYFVRYLNALNSVVTVIKDGIKLDDEIFLEDVYEARQYEEFEKDIKENAQDNAAKQIKYIEKHFEQALNAIITRRFYAGAVPKQVIMTFFTFHNQEKRRDCVEASVFDLLVSLVLYNPVTKAFDLSLLPEGVKIHDQLLTLIKDGIDLEYTKKVKNNEGNEEEIKVKENIKLTPQTLNNSYIRQAWYNFVSGHYNYKDNEGNLDANKNLIYCRGKEDGCYELDTHASNVIRIANLVYGLDAQNFDELGKKLSTNNRTIHFTGPKDPLSTYGDSNNCIITMTINKNAVMAELKLTFSHALLTVPLRNVSSVLNQYYSPDIGQQLLKTSLLVPKTQLLCSLFSETTMLDGGELKLPLSMLYLLYYSLNMNDSTTRTLVVCDMIAQVKYYQSLLPHLGTLIKSLLHDASSITKIVTAILRQPNSLAIITGLLKADPKLFTSNIGSISPTEELLIVAAAAGKIDVVKYIIEAIKPGEKIESNALVMAAMGGQLEVIKYLLETDTIKVGYKNNAFLFAVQTGRLEIVKYLLNNGAEINAQDKFGSTALVLAARAGQIQLVKYLLDEINKDNNRVDQKNKLDSGAAVNAVVEVYINHKIGLDECLTILEYLVKDGNADLDFEAYLDDLPNTTSLIRAASAGSLDLVKFLVEHGANINARDFNDNSPLNYAVKKGHQEIAEYLKKAEEELKKNREKKE